MDISSLEEIIQKTSSRNWFLNRDYNDHHTNLKSVWTGVYVLLLLWVLSLFLKHISDAVLQQRQAQAMPEERRQFLQTPRERSRSVSWGDRFKRGAFLSRTAFLMLLATAIFASLPVQHPCPREGPAPSPPPSISLSFILVPESAQPQDDLLKINRHDNNMNSDYPHRPSPLFPRSYHHTHHVKHHLNDENYRDIQILISEDDEETPILPLPTENPQPPRQRPPHRNPNPQPPPHKRPLPPPSPPGHEQPLPPNPLPPPHKRPLPPPSPPGHEQPLPPMPPKAGQKKCYSNSVTDGVLTLSWIFVGLSILWYILELSVVDLKSSALTRSIMGTFSFPLIIAAFAVVFNQWTWL